jgi:protocatechuate 3,4-dioxygenase beta subunit
LKPPQSIEEEEATMITRRTAVYIVLAGFIGLCQNMQAAVAVGGVVTASDGGPLQATILVVERGSAIGVRHYGSGPTGEFSFTVDGQYPTILVARAEGYVSAERALELAGRSERLDFHLVPAGKVSGRVVDENGIGVEGATVCVRYPGTPGRSLLLTQETGMLQTDEYGYFTLPMVARDTEFAVDAFTDSRPPSRSPSHLLSSASMSGVEVRLNRVGYTVRGSVVDRYGRPVYSAEVRVRAVGELAAFSEDERQSLAFLLAVTKKAVTDEQGRYAVHGMPAGRVAVVAGGKGEPPSTKEERVLLGGEVPDVNLILP